MKQAILAAEDERFYQHGGVDYLSVAARRARQRRLRHPAGRRHDHDAGRPQLLPDPREDGHPQAARGAARLEDRGQPVQGRDPRALRQPDLPRPARLRLRRRVADLLRQAAARTSPSPRRRCWPDCPRRRPPTTRSPTPSAPRPASCTCCGGCTSSTSSPTTQFKEAQNAPLAVRQGVRDALPDPRRVRRRNGPAGGVRRVRRGGLHPGHHGLDDDPQGRPGGRLRRRAPRRARLRPPARLPRARGLRQPARRPGRAGAGARPGVPGNRRQRQPRGGGRAARRRRREVRAVLASGDTVARHRRRPQVRRPQR